MRNSNIILVAAMAVTFIANPNFAHADESEYCWQHEAKVFVGMEDVPFISFCATQGVEECEELFCEQGRRALPCPKGRACEKVDCNSQCQYLVKAARDANETANHRVSRQLQQAYFGGHSFNVYTESLASRIGERAFGLRQASTDQVATKMEQWCSTTEAPEMCERNLAICALTKSHPESREISLAGTMKFPRYLSHNYDHELWSNTLLGKRMNQNLILICARDATTRWVARRRLDAQVREGVQIVNWMFRIPTWFWIAFFLLAIPMCAMAMRNTLREWERLLLRVRFIRNLRTLWRNRKDKR